MAVEMVSTERFAAPADTLSKELVRAVDSLGTDGASVVRWYVARALWLNSAVALPPEGQRGPVFLLRQTELSEGGIPRRWGVSALALQSDGTLLRRGHSHPDPKLFTSDHALADLLLRQGQNVAGHRGDGPTPLGSWPLYAVDMARGWKVTEGRRFRATGQQEDGTPLMRAGEPLALWLDQMFGPDDPEEERVLTACGEGRFDVRGQGAVPGRAFTVDLLPSGHTWRAAMHSFALFTAQRLTCDFDGLLAGPADRPGERSETYHDLMGALYAQLHQGLRTAAEAFNAYLDPGRLQALEEAPRRTEGLYNWLAAGGDPVLSRNRQQAVAAYPLFALDLKADDQLNNAVDRGLPLGKCIAIRRRLPQASLRTLQAAGRMALPAGTVLTEPFDKELAVVVEGLAGLPPQGHPRGAAEWAGFHRLVAALRTHGTGLWPERMIDGAGRWGRLPSEAAAWGEDMDYGDTVNGFFAHLLVPAAFHRFGPGDADGPSIAVIDWVGGALRRVLTGRDYLVQRRIDGAWHASQDRLGHILDQLKESVEGGAGIASDTVHKGMEDRMIGGVRILPLISREAILAERDAMRHCIGTYVAKAMAGGCALLSLRDAVTGAHLSSTELVPQGERWEVVQHRGPRNNTPPAAACGALREYMTLLPRPTAQEVQARRRWENTAWKQSPWTPAFDWRDIDVLQGLFAHYRPWLPRTLRTSRVEAFHEALTG